MCQTGTLCSLAHAIETTCQQKIFCAAFLLRSGSDWPVSSASPSPCGADCGLFMLCCPGERSAVRLGRSFEVVAESERSIDDLYVPGFVAILGAKRTRSSPGRPRRGAEPELFARLPTQSGRPAGIRSFARPRCKNRGRGRGRGRLRIDRFRTHRRRRPPARIAGCSCSSHDLLTIFARGESFGLRTRNSARHSIRFRLAFGLISQKRLPGVRVGTNANAMVSSMLEKAIDLALVQCFAISLATTSKAFKVSSISSSVWATET